MTSLNVRRAALVLAGALAFHAALLLAWTTPMPLMPPAPALHVLSLRILPPSASPDAATRQVPIRVETAVAEAPQAPGIAVAPPVLPTSGSRSTAVLHIPEPPAHGANIPPRLAPAGTASPTGTSPQVDSPDMSSQPTEPPVRPATEAKLSPAPDYWTAGRLDPGPRPLHDIEPVYPDEAQLRSGAVVLRLLIGATGSVDDVAVVRSRPPGLFDASARAAFGSAEFAPGLLAGVPVKSQITIEVQFTPINRGSAVAGRSY